MLVYRAYIGVFMAKIRREMCGGKDNTKLKVSHIVVNSPYFF